MESASHTRHYLKLPHSHTLGPPDGQYRAHHRLLSPSSTSPSTTTRPKTPYTESNPLRQHRSRYGTFENNQYTSNINLATLQTDCHRVTFLDPRVRATTRPAASAPCPSGCRASGSLGCGQTGWRGMQECDRDGRQRDRNPISACRPGHP